MKGHTATLGLLLALSMPTAAARADIYSFTDENGVTHYTNVPSDARFQVLLHSAPEMSEAGARISPAMLARSAEFDAIIDTVAAQTSVEASLLRAVIVVESAFDPDAVSRRGARGLMQLMPATAKAYGARNVDDPAQNVHAGARYLRDLIDRYENNLELVLAAYNAGETAVERHGRKVPPFAETRDYVPRVLRVYRSLREIAIDS
jgi:soluble lytic murein transglycosylase-like protein